MEFFVGLHQPADARHFEDGSVCISVHRLKDRKRAFPVQRWMLDSGAFTTIATHGGYHEPVSAYAAQIHRWASVGQLAWAVAQDYMCEPMMLKKTGLTVRDHQRLTIARYDALLDRACPVPILPVLQGYHPQDYRAHVEQYGDRLPLGARAGVGSVCKRNADPREILLVLRAIRSVRPDLRLHGFGLKVTALSHPVIRQWFASADSMAWSYAARKQGRNANDWREAAQLAARVAAMECSRSSLPFETA